MPGRCEWMSAQVTGKPRIARPRSALGPSTGAAQARQYVFGQLGNLATMFRQAQQIGGQLEGLNESLRGKRATGNAGGGLVEVEFNGLQEMLSCRIDPHFSSKGIANWSRIWCAARRMTPSPKLASFMVTR